MKNSIVRIVAVAIISLFNGSSAFSFTWTPGWSLPDGTAMIDMPRAEAQRLGDAIDSPETAKTAIAAWEAFTRAHPDDTAAWIELGCLRLLEGAAFRHSSKARLACYIAGLQACERAMATNPDFLRRVKNGESLSHAANALGSHEMGAMHFWATGMFYIFRDCLGFFGRIANSRYMDTTKAMLLRIDALDPSWENHTNTFNWAIYYLAMPSSRGGDKAKARQFFDQAVALGENRAVPRWGRGKYYHVAMGETAASQADLASVANQDINKLRGNRAWNRYLQADARRLLTR